MVSDVQIPAPREVGYQVSNPDGSYWSMDEERVPELRWPACLRTYNQMRTDAQVRSVLKAITLPIRATTWRLDPNGAPDEVVEFVADQLGLPVIGWEGKPSTARRRGRFSWDEHLRMALLMLPYGAMFFEQVTETLPDGRWGLRKLAPRMPTTLEDIKVARDGGLVGIVQKPPALIGAARAWDASRSVIPVDRLVAYVNEREGAAWAGESVLRAAYKSWLLKDRLLRLETVGIDRNSLGVPVYTNPPNATSEDIEKGRQMATSYRAGDGSGASLPFDSKLNLLGVSGQLADPRPAIEYHDSQIGKSALAHFLNLDGKGGSYALAAEQAELFTTALTAAARAVSDTASQHIVEDLVDWNWGSDVPAPLVTHDSIAESQLAVATALRTLVDAGVILPDRSLEEHIRRGLDLPAKDYPPKEDA